MSYTREELDREIGLSLDRGEPSERLGEIAAEIARRSIGAQKRRIARELREDALGYFFLEFAKRWKSIQTSQNPVAYLRRLATWSLANIQRVESRKVRVQAKLYQRCQRRSGFGGNSRT